VVPSCVSAAVHSPPVVLDTVLILCLYVFFFNDTATTEIYTLSLHDALPISRSCDRERSAVLPRRGADASTRRSEEHTSELQSHLNLVCRLLLEKKKKTCNGHSPCWYCVLLWRAEDSGRSHSCMLLALCLYSAARLIIFPTFISFFFFK